MIIMKLIYSLLFSLCLGLGMLAPAQAITITQLQKQITQYPTVKADFVLQKTVTALNIPFEASGKMIFDRHLGLWWQQTDPFQQTIKANQNRITLAIGDQPAQSFTAAMEPQLFQLSKLVNAVFNGDIKTLEDNFTLALSQIDDSNWQLQLTPKTASLKKLARQITISGDQFIQKIEVNEPQNGKTNIYFANHVTLPLTAEQQRLFN